MNIERKTSPVILRLPLNPLEPTVVTDRSNVGVLARYLPIFDRDGYTGGTWSNGKQEGGTDTLPFFSLDEDASAFVQACYDHGWVLPDFDWPAFANTPEAAALRDDLPTLAQASTQQLAQLLTSLIRADRFAEGTLASAIESGLVRRILSRAGQIGAMKAGTSGKSRYGAQVREVINRNTFISLALAEGFNAYLPVYDGGIDFVLHREGDGLIRKVQLKGRWTIDRKYEGRDLWVAFPIGSEWHLMPHDRMVALAEAQGKTKTESWVKAGLYSMGKPSKAVIAACQPFRFQSIETVALQAADPDLDSPNLDGKPSA